MIRAVVTKRREIVLLLIHMTGVGTVFAWYLSALAGYKFLPEPYLGLPRGQMSVPQHFITESTRYTTIKTTSGNHTPALPSSTMQIPLERAKQAAARHGHCLRQPTYPFMALPRELRDMIYERLAEDIHVKSHNQRLDYQFLRSRIPILQSNKVIEQECIPILLSRATIELRVQDTGKPCVYINEFSTIPPPHGLVMHHPLRYEVSYMRYRTAVVFSRATFWRPAPGGNPIYSKEVQKRLVLPEISQICSGAALQFELGNPTWYHAITKKENLWGIFEGRETPSVDNLREWCQFTDSIESTLKFKYRIEEPSSQPRPGRQRLDSITADNMKAIYWAKQRLSTKHNALKELADIRDAYHLYASTV